MVNEFVELISKKGVDNEYISFVIEKINNWLSKVKNFVTKKGGID